MRAEARGVIRPLLEKIGPGGTAEFLQSRAAAQPVALKTVLISI